MAKDTEPVFTKIDKDIKDRMDIFITESKLANIDKTSNQKKFIETACHEYMIRNPIQPNNAI